MLFFSLPAFIQCVTGATILLNQNAQATAGSFRTMVVALLTAPSKAFTTRLSPKRTT